MDKRVSFVLSRDDTYSIGLAHVLGVAVGALVEWI